MKSTIYLLIALSLSLFSASDILDTRQEVRLALIIGNGNYDTFGDLKSPLRNVDSMRLLLKNEMNFRSVDYLKDGTHRQMENKLDAFYRKVSSYDKSKYKVVALFFYSGHGLADDNKKNYLIPTDAKINCPRDLKYEAINLDRILEELDTKRSFLNLLMIDACRNTDYISKKLRECKFKDNPTMELPPDMFDGIEKPKIERLNSGTFISFSASYGKTASSGDNDSRIVNSPYVAAFLDNVRVPNKTAVELFTKDVSRGTKKLTGQSQQPTTEIKFDDYFYFKTATTRPIDSDGDGYPDNRDDCPNTYWTTNNGCPPAEDKNLPALAYVQGGSFQMGSNEYSNEQPIHTVTIKDFNIGKYEVTVKEYLAFCEATNSNYPEWLEVGNKYHVETGTDGYYKNKGYSRTGSDNLPIVGVSWNNAKAYCKWLSETTGQTYRLPTEAEWEYAARGGNQSNGYKYSGSNNIDEVAWYNDNSGSKTHPVGTKKANELGIYDMSGNVWEWCEDKWHDNYQNAPTDGSAWLQNGDNTRVLRGGSWVNLNYYCRVAYRFNLDPTIRSYYLGFRVVRGD